MLKEMKRQLKRNGKDMLTIYLFAAGVALILTVLIALLTAAGVFKPDLSQVDARIMPDIGGIFFWVITGFTTMVFTAVYVVVEYRLVLRFGALRKYYISCLLLRTAVFTVLMMESGRLWWAVSLGAGKLFGLQLEPIPALSRWILPMVSLLLVALGFWAGALIQRYQQKGAAFVWLIWMFVFLGWGLIRMMLDRLFDGLGTKVATFFSEAFAGMGQGGIILMGILAVMALVFHGWRMVRKAEA